MSDHDTHGHGGERPSSPVATAEDMDRKLESCPHCGLPPGEMGCTDTSCAAEEMGIKWLAESLTRHTADD